MAPQWSEKVVRRKQRFGCCLPPLSAQVLIPLLLILGAARAWASDIPFSPRKIIDGTFDGASSVHAADLDGDGDLDVLGSAADDDDIAWWENNNGAGTSWTEHTVDGAFGGARSLYAADMDSDGDLDVLGAASLVNTITWWENNNGAGTSWTEHTIDAFYNGASEVRAADVDDDGDLDVLGSASRDDAITWWENNNGAGTSWTKRLIRGSFAAAWSVDAADMDGDGDLDVLGAAEVDAEITWFENTNGAGTSWTEHTVDDSFFGAFSLDAADMDGDGDSDVVSANFFDDVVTWWENNNGVGTSWTEHTIENTASARQVQTADVDGDGDLDVLGADEFQDHAAWYENANGTGTSWVKHIIDGDFESAQSLYAADLDGDGDLDVLGAAAGDNDIAWWENETIHRNAVYPVENTIDGSLTGPVLTRAADLDGDGDLDALGAVQFDNDIAWWRNNDGAGTSWTKFIADGNFGQAASVHAADVDGDGDLDLLGAANSGDAANGGDIAWWENLNGAGTSWTEHTVDDTFGVANSVYAADLDSDGDMDVLGAALLDDDITWWENTNGAGTSWTERTIDASFDGAFAVHAADLDGDGDLDVLGAAETDDEIAWWEHSGASPPTWSARHVMDGSFDGARSVYAADVDGDGDLDVLGAALIDDEIAWWENDGASPLSWSARKVIGSFVGAASVHAADVDCDGDLDVVGAATIADDITWWENADGAGTSWIEHTIDGAFDGARSVHAADINSDSQIDVLGAAFSDGDITWWENRGGQFALPTTSLAPAQITSSGEEAVLQIDAVHNGRTGDTDVELVTFELLFDDGTTPLTEAQANSVIQNLRVYLDNGSGVFEPTDPVVDTVSSLALTAGVQEFSFADGNTDGQVVFGADRRYFVVPEFFTDGLVDMVRVTHLTESSSTGEDRDHDIPLKLEHSANVSTPTIDIILALGVTSVEIGRYETPVKTKNAAVIFVAGDTFSAGDNVTIRALVADGSTGRPVANATVEISLSGPQAALLTTAPSGADGWAYADWQTHATADKKGNDATNTGLYTATVTNVTKDGAPPWDGVGTSTQFTLQ